MSNPLTITDVDFDPEAPGDVVDDQTANAVDSLETFSDDLNRARTALGVETDPGWSDAPPGVAIPTHNDDELYPSFTLRVHDAGFTSVDAAYNGSNDPSYLDNEVTGTSPPEGSIVPTDTFITIHVNPPA